MTEPRDRLLRGIASIFRIVAATTFAVYVGGSLLAYLINGRGVWKLVAFAQPVSGLFLPLFGRGELFGLTVHSFIWWGVAGLSALAACLSAYARRRVTPSAEGGEPPEATSTVAAEPAFSGKRLSPERVHRQGGDIDRVLLADEFAQLFADSGGEQVRRNYPGRLPKSVGQILVERGLLTHEQLDRALEEHRNVPKSLGRVLMDMDLISEADLVRALGEQAGVEFVDLSEYPVDPAAVELLPDALARRYRAIPIGERDGKLLVAMSDPANVYVLDDVRAITSREIQPMIATATDVDAAITRYHPSAPTNAVSEPQESIPAQRQSEPRPVVPPG